MWKLDQGRLNLLKSQVWKVKVQEVVLHHQPQARVAPVQYQPQNQLLHNLHCECLPCARLVVHLLAVWELLQVPYTVDPPLHNLIIQPRQLGHQEAVQLHCLTLSVLPHQLGHAHVLVQSALQVKELLDNTFVVSDILDYHAVHQHSELLVHRHGHIPPIHLVHTAHANYEQVSTMCLCTKGSYSLACTHVFYIGQLPPKNYLAVASHHMQCDQALIHVRLHHSQHHDALPPQVPPPSGQHAQDIRVHHHGVAGATQQDTHGHGKHGQLGLDRVGAPFHQLRVEVAGTEVTHSPAVIGLHQPSPSQHEHDIHHQLHWAQDDQCVQPVQEGFHPIHIHLHVKHSQFLILQYSLSDNCAVVQTTVPWSTLLCRGPTNCANRSATDVPKPLVWQQAPRVWQAHPLNATAPTCTVHRPHAPEVLTMTAVTGTALTWTASTAPVGYCLISILQWKTCKTSYQTF